MLQAIEWLNRAAMANGVRLRQSYLRVARRARKEAARLMHGRSHKQAKAHLRFMRTQLGRLICDIERKIAGNPAHMEALASVLERARTIHGQKPARAYVDRGYRGHGLNRDGLKAMSPTRVASPHPPSGEN